VFRFVASATVVLIAVTVVLSDEFGAAITKFEDGKITFRKFSFKKKEKAEEETLPVARDCKFVKAKFNKEEKKVETGEALEGGKEGFAKRVKEAAANKGEKGFGAVFALVITSGEGADAKVTEIRVFPTFKGKGKKKKDAD
jgi:hypothetical protein